MTPVGVRFVPFLSGNALRHRCVRAPGARWLVDTYRLAGKLTLAQLNFLFHGGALTEKGMREDTARIAAMQRTWPLLRLVGGCLPDQILAGSLLCGRGTLVCEENRRKLESALGDLAGCLPTRLRPAETFISGFQYTRSDARNTRADLMSHGERAEADAATSSNLMIFAGQSVIRGAAFVQELILPNVARIEIGALLHAISLWQRGGGTVGGQGSRGHGHLATSIVGIDHVDHGDAVAEYVAHATAVRDDAVAWLDAAFTPRLSRAEKAAQAATAAAGA